MRVLYIVSTLKNSGPTNQLHGIASNLNHTVYTPTILTLSPEPQDSCRNDFKQSNITFKSLNHGRLAGMLYNRTGITKAISEFQPDVIHTQGFRADCLLSRIKLPCPWILTIRNDPWFDFPMKFGKTQGTWMAWKHIKAIQHATIAACCSETTASIFRSRYKAQNILAVQNGVNTEKYQPVKPTQREQLRKKLGFPENTKVFLSASTLVKRKDIGTLIQGFQSANIENSQLLILGNGPEYSTLKALTHSSPNIQFLGNVTNVNEYLAASDYFVSASLSEGLPNSVLEAMASGLPVILSDIPNHCEVLVKSSFKESLLFPVGEPQALSDSLVQVCQQNHGDLAEQMRRIIEENFSSSIMSLKYQEIYKNCIEDQLPRCA